MSGGFVWMLVALGLAVVVVRRRSVAVALVTVQALVLVAVALDDATDADDVVAGVALGLRALLLAAFLLVLVARTREPRPVRARVSPLARGGAAIALALALTWLVPEIGLESRDAERAVLALVAFGIVTAARGGRRCSRSSGSCSSRTGSRSRRSSCRAGRRSRSSSASRST